MLLKYPFRFPMPETLPLPDLTDRGDVVRLVDRFYEHVQDDGILGPVFSDMGKPTFDPAKLTPEQKARYASYREGADS